MRNRLFLYLLALTTIFSIVPASAVLSSDLIPTVFDKLLNSRVLADPAMVLIDGKTGEVIYERNSQSLRKPASVIKLLSGAVTLEYLDPSSRFVTSAYMGLHTKTLVIEGSLDPWISLNNLEAKKMHRTSLPRFATYSMRALKSANHGSLKNISVKYYGLYSQDIAHLKAFWAKRGFKPTFISVSKDAALAAKGESVFSSQSPTVEEILNFTMLWSDNLLAERLARLASRAAGYGSTDLGVTTTFHALLNRLNIDGSQLVIADGSGLSKEDRVSAQVIGQLLFKIRGDAKFELLYKSLPVSGISGTLKNRFTATAPSAVGLVHAKTGTLNGTVALAGYVESSDREYIFAILADKILIGSTSENKARAAIDRLLGQIAAPFIETQVSQSAEKP